MLLQEHSSCLCRGENGKPFCLAELWPALIVRIHWDFTINAVHAFQNTKKSYLGFTHAPLKFMYAPRKDKHFIGQLWQLMTASNVVRKLRHDRPSGRFSKSRGLSASISFLSSPPPPCSFTCAIFCAVFDSCLSFLAPKPHRNACYAGYAPTRWRNLNLTKLSPWLSACPM